MYYTAFFFSSRRRHTRFDCDWSSDVCSSDLPPERAGERFHKTSQAAAKGTAKPSVVPRQGAIPFGVRIPDRNRKPRWEDRKSTRLNSSHSQISYAVFCLKKTTHSRSGSPPHT